MNVYRNGEKEIFEPILRDRTKQIETGRSIQTINHDTVSSFTEDEIMEPVLRSTTIRTKDSSQTIPPTNLNNRTLENPLFTVQLLPLRLSELFERAERYARETLLPLISEQAPKIFGFGAMRNESYERMPKYIPSLAKKPHHESKVVSSRKIDLPPILDRKDYLFENTDDDTDNIGIIINNHSVEDVEGDKVGKSRGVSIGGWLTNDQTDTNSSEQNHRKNILNLLRSKEIGSVASTASLTPVIDDGPRYSVTKSQTNYYTSPVALQSDDNLKVVRIDLPTYKPLQRKSSFPFQFDIPPDN